MAREKKTDIETKAKIVDSYDEIEKVLDDPIGDIESDESISQETIAEKLTLRQEKFCQLYALDTRFMGNGVQAYLDVYDIDTTKTGWYKTACACASILLSNSKVYTRINNLLESSGLNDQFVDKQLLFVISQQADIGNKVQAIKEYNKLKQRITDKMEHS